MIKRTLCANAAAAAIFYAQIKGKYPELETFLSKFGVDISRPDELPWWDAADEIEYKPCDTVSGSIETVGQYEIDFGGVNVVISRGDTPFASIPNEQTEPYFVIAVYNISLPWVLDEPFTAPQNESFFQKIGKRFLELRKNGQKS